MRAKNQAIPPSPSTESLSAAGGWRISTAQAAASSSSSMPDDDSPVASPRGAAAAAVAGAVASADCGPASTSSSGSSPPAAASSPSSSSAWGRRDNTPLPLPVYALMRLIYSRRQLESLFDDAIDPDEQQEEERERERAATAGRAAAAAAARSGGESRQRRQQPEGDDKQDQDDTNNADNDERARVRAIREALSEAAEDARARLPWLLSAGQQQDAVGLAILLGSACALVALFCAYGRGLVPALLVVPLAALLTSFLHELEHDLIHSLYFRGRHLALPFASFFSRGFSPGASPASPASLPGPRLSAIDAALAVCYAFRPSTINPWARRTLHLNHHRASGSAGDLEERSITNGLAWSPLRLLATGDNLLAILLRPHQTLREMRAYLRAQPAAVKGDPQARVRMIAVNGLGYAPLGFVHYALWWSFLVLGELSLALGGAAGSPPALLAAAFGLANAAPPAWLWPALRFYAVTFGAPQFLRTFCLHLVSSNVHYYRGGTRAPALADQTQIVDSPLFWPFQLFCFNFGATHALHHFAPAQTFYLRQAVSGDARVRAALKAGGVRFNDFGTFGRGNRLPAAAASSSA